MPKINKLSGREQIFTVFLHNPKDTSTEVKNRRPISRQKKIWMTIFGRLTEARLVQIRSQTTVEGVNKSKFFCRKCYDGVCGVGSNEWKIHDLNFALHSNVTIINCCFIDSYAPKPIIKLAFLLITPLAGFYFSSPPRPKLFETNFSAKFLLPINFSPLLRFLAFYPDYLFPILSFRSSDLSNRFICEYSFMECWYSKTDHPLEVNSLFEFLGETTESCSLHSHVNR